VTHIERDTEVTQRGATQRRGTFFAFAQARVNKSFRHFINPLDKGGDSNYHPSLDVLHEMRSFILNSQSQGENSRHTIVN